MDSVASRYAIALLSIAKEENKVIEYVKEVEDLLKVFEVNPDLVMLLKDHGLSKDEIIQKLKLNINQKKQILMTMN